MARGKKKESALTPEEKLAQALVPDWEQPYKVPNNWKWIILGNLVDIHRGASPRPIKAYITEDETGVNWIKIGDTDSGKYVTRVSEKITTEGARKSVFVEEGTLLLSNSMSFGRPYILKVDGCIHDGWLAITPSMAFNKEYLYYALLASEWYFEQVAVGTAVRNLNSERVAGTPIPCPPIAEQQRIVDRIEYLFAKLDEAKEKAQYVLDSFETRKAAILHKAFTGELTAKWRAEHGVNLDGWQQTTIGKESLLITKGASPRWQGITYTDDKSQTLFVTSENVRDGYLDLTKEKYLDNRINEIQRRSVLQKGDVLVNIVGASIGRAAIFDLECLANTNQAVCLIRLKGSVVNRFLCYYLNSPVALTYYGENKVETARANISLTNISDMGIALPSVVEQHEIVSILDSLFAKEQQAKEAAEAVLEKIDLLKKSILARAFRGELGTNDPTEESAVELLREILKGDI